jgi:AcrR family transcriptional regulator
MSTKESIIQLADQLIRDKGYNAFSFYDIAKTLGIKNASIHYYFPGKAQLGIAVVGYHSQRLQVLKQTVAGLAPLKKIKAFIYTYAQTHLEERVCLVGSLASALHTLEPALGQQLKTYSQELLNWLEEVLEEGRQSADFSFTLPARTKALMIITNLLAALQLSRLTGAQDFYTIAETIIQELSPVLQKEKQT